MLSRLEGVGMMEVFARTAISGMVALACVVAVKNTIIRPTPLLAKRLLAPLGLTYALAHPLISMTATLLATTATAATFVCTAECGLRASAT